MIVIIDDRQLVTEGYVALFKREGFCCVGFDSAEFDSWASAAPVEELRSVRALFVSDEAARMIGADLHSRFGDTPRLALLDQPSLDVTLQLFASGFHDVVRKPVHVKELLARIGVVRQRHVQPEGEGEARGLKVFLDGRDPEIDGIPFKLPRREQRILEYLASVEGRRVTRAQIFTATYGIMEDDVEECVVESHISKLRKKLRERLGHDPVDSKRFLGYRLELGSNEAEDAPAPALQNAGKVRARLAA